MLSSIINKFHLKMNNEICASFIISSNAITSEEARHFFSFHSKFAIQKSFFGFFMPPAQSIIDC